MKILIIGGTGHVGSFLAPQLNAEGHKVVVVTRGKTALPHQPGWEGIEFRIARCDPNDASWRRFLADEEAEVIIDFPGVAVLTTYDAARNDCKHFIACGSLWMFGNPQVVPTPEQTQSLCEFAGYAQRYQQINQLLDQARKDGIAFTAIMPPNICGPGKIPLDCSGGRSLELHKKHSRGEPVTLPYGCNTLIGPCDASDIARAFTLAATHRDASAGHVFNVGAAYSLTAPELVRVFSEIYQTQIPIKWVESKVYFENVLPDPGANYHFRHHMLPDLSKITSKLGYRPEFTPEQSLARAVEWMRKTW